MKIKQRPEDFVVREGYRFDEDPEGPVWVYRMDKQKVSTLQALERLSKEFSVRRRNLSVCGLKDKQGRTEQLVGVQGQPLAESEVVQSGDLRLKLLGRSATPLSSENITANRFEVTVRDLSAEEAERVPESAAEVDRVGVVNYFDSQRFGFLKHGQGLIAKDLLKGDFEAALRRYLATPSELDRSDDAKVKRFWSEHWGEWQLRAPGEAAAKYAPMLRQLRQDPRNFKGALLHVDRRVRMMMLFELQSLVWNEGVKRYLSRKVPASEMIGLRYQAGSLVLPRALPRQLRDELWSKTFPLLAPDSRIEDPEIRSAALDALAQQQLRLENLAVPGTPMFFKHEERPIFVRPGKMRVNPPRPDELNRGRQKINLSFTLPPGAYATLVVRRVLWFASDKAAQPAAALPRGQKWGQPKPPAEPRKPQTPKKGFLERQRERKTARAQRRAEHAPKGRRR
jgi:tRNA pseudouridine13 synthase